MCYLSFCTGLFPDEFKIANVVPIFKSGDEIIFSNNRPVSVLPVYKKIIERLMYNRLLKYINDNDLLYKYQFGFQKGRSTHMALIKLIDNISEALENGDCIIGMIFLDFSKAFDTVDQTILLQKLCFCGIQDITQSWFENYLSIRKQYVTYNGNRSKTEKFKCGVLQGSKLGPLLFLIHINDLSTVSEAFMSILFADDTNMFTGNNIQTMTIVINDELIKVQEWLQCNKFFPECPKNSLHNFHI